MGNSARHRWIYAGLALADGVGLVSAIDPRPPSRPPPPLLLPADPSPLLLAMAAEAPVTVKVERPMLVPGEHAALFGDALAAGLLVALTHLTKEADVDLYAQGRHASRVEDWAGRGWFQDVLKTRPRVILGAFRWGTILHAEAMHQLEQLALAQDARVVWLAPPGALPATIVGLARSLNELRAGRPYWPHRIFRSDGLSISMGPDGETPSALGFAGWAGALWAYLS